MSGLGGGFVSFKVVYPLKPRQLVGETLLGSRILLLTTGLTGWGAVPPVRNTNLV